MSEPSRLAWRHNWGAPGDDEARAYLQERLRLFTQLMFASFVILLAFLLLMYEVYPAYAPSENNLIFGGAAVLLVIMAGVWRLVLQRGTLTLEALYGIDLLYAVCIGAAFALSAVLSYPLRAAAYASLVYGVCTVFTRAIVVPSTGPRTLATSIATFAPMLGAAVYLAVETEQELPGPAFVAAMLVLSGVAIALAARGSDVIYGLRRKVREATQLGQYSLGGKIGAGGMGEVFHARHVLLRRPTAVKLLKPDKVGAEWLDRFEREVQHMSQLTHPNTVAVFDYGRNQDGVLYYAMEYLDGINLGGLVALDGPQPAARVASILAQVAGALQEAHDRNLIHRDIKPENIILCERGGMPDVAKVVDFGIAKEIVSSSAATTDVLLGTIGYIAPEVMVDPAKLSPSVDIYALGAVGYFLVTGRRVFEGKTSIDEFVQHVTQAPRPIDNAPPELAAIIMKCLAKQPEARYGSAAELAEALEALPKAGDWNRKQAQQWWRQYRTKQAAAPSADAPTQTIQIDLVHRSTEP